MVVRLRLRSKVTRCCSPEEWLVSGVSVSPGQPPAQHHHGDTRSDNSQDAGVALTAGQWTLHVTDRKLERCSVTTNTVLTTIGSSTPTLILIGRRNILMLRIPGFCCSTRNEQQLDDWWMKSSKNTENLPRTESWKLRQLSLRRKTSGKIRFSSLQTQHRHTLSL